MLFFHLISQNGFCITKLFIVEYLLTFQGELNSVDAARGFILFYCIIPFSYNIGLLIFVSNFFLCVLTAFVHVANWFNSFVAWILLVCFLLVHIPERGISVSSSYRVVCGRPMNVLTEENLESHMRNKCLNAMDNLWSN